VDLVGIMRYSAYTRVFDVAEAELFRALALGYPDGPARMGGWLLRKVLHVEYLAPARFDAELRVRTWPGRIGSTSLTLHFEVTDGAAAVRHAHGHFVLVFVDGEMRKRELPDVLVAAVRRLG
jgi:acyl-CoA thioester hydrolase